MGQPRVATAGQPANVQQPSQFQPKPASLAELAAPASPHRALHVFELPESAQTEVKSFGIVELTSQEELNYSARAAGDEKRSTPEMLQEALRQVNGHPVSLADGSVEVAINKMSSKARSLLLKAVVEVNLPSKEEIESFSKSKKIVL